MAHKFSSEHMHRLDSEQRRKELPPEYILETLRIKPGDIWADIGCGIGYFSIPAARKLLPGGEVFAIDTSEEMLNELTKRVRSNNLSNIIPILSKEYHFIIEPESCNVALAVNVLHEIEDKRRFLREMKRIVKNRGWFGIVEWNPASEGGGPPPEERISEDELTSLLESVGADTEHIFQIGERYYGALAQV